MYFRVNDDFLQKPQELEDGVLALRNLISAFGAGHHHLVISRSLCDLIIERCDLSQREKDLLVAYVKARHTLAASEIKGVWRFVDCVPDACAAPLEANGVRVRLRQFDDPMHVGSTRLLVEDVPTDAPALKLLVNLYAKFVLGDRQRTSFNFLHGGGAGAAGVFRHAYESPQPIICAVDSDRRFPGGPLGNTATAVLEALNDAPFPTAFVCILPVREIENAFPLRLVRIAYQDHGANDISGCCQSLIEYCESAPAEEQSRAELVAFFDLKDGLNANDVAAIAANFSDLLVAFWEYRMTSVPAPHPEAPEFLSANPFGGIAANMARVVNSKIEEKPHLLKDIGRNLRKHPFATELTEFVRQIIDICAAPSPLPIRLI